MPENVDKRVPRDVGTGIPCVLVTNVVRIQWQRMLDLKTSVQLDIAMLSVGRALRVQSDSMRTKRRQIAEEKAAKTAVQLLFPLVIFIFPGIFVVLVGPAAITIMQEMLTM